MLVAAGPEIGQSDYEEEDSDGVAALDTWPIGFLAMRTYYWPTPRWSDAIDGNCTDAHVLP